ncbi:LCP family protein [Streptomyces sp. NRRL B-24484]|uniref:LCP family glycopolymer transferase n=1 Tax=Streptomyces sp. NRRL B-24484 TaxID=1463833 RepID=UPI0004BF4DE5|nr:LCP family protein [Streptomyces sp. NRRL B-24484]
MSDKSGPAAASRGTGRRLARIAGATAAVLVLATAGAGAWFYHRLDQNISTFSADGVATNRPPAGPTAAGGGRPVNILLLGSDTRSDGNGALGGGDEGVGHSDTAILLHVYADHRHAVGVSVPRDTLVTVPPCKLPNGTWTSERSSQMFNSAFTVGLYPQGNPACTQNTVEALTGLRVDHTIVVDFKGFAAMTDALHGVDVCVPNDVDSYGIHLTKGRRTLSGQQALDYVRARHGFGDGSDIGRMKRQQAFLSSLIKKVQGQGFDLTTLLPLADAATRSLTVDEELGSAMKLATFAQSLQDIKLADISFVTVPWEYAGARVALVHPDVDTLWELLRQDRTLDGRATAPATTATPTTATPTTATPTTATPTTATPSAPAAPTPSATAAPSTGAPAGPDATAAPVTVHNASGATGTAGRAATALAAHGYREVVVGANTKGRNTTTVGYSSGHKAAAEQLAALYPGATVRPDPEADGLVLTLGQDHASGDTSGPVTLPSGIPTGISSNTRPADSDLCADLSFG